MNRIIIKGLLFGCIGSFLFACEDKKTEATTVVAIDKDQIKKEIQAKEDTFASVYNSGEARNIGYYADDAISYLQNRPPLVGKDSIVAFLKRDVLQSSDRISFKTNEVYVSSDANQVVEIGSFLVVDSMNLPINTGNYMSLFEKRNGKYVAVRDMSASNVPLK